MKMEGAESGMGGNAGSFAVAVLNWGAHGKNIQMQMLSNQLALRDWSSGDESRDKGLGAVSM